MVSNNGSLQLPAAPTASTMSTTVATADDIDVHRHESQEPLRSEASPEASAIDVAVIWVSKAGKGSTQWTDTASLRQLKHYKFRKQLKPLTVLIKYLFLALAFFEVPSWCLNPSRDQGSCLTREGLYSWNIPLLPFQVSNALDIFCLLYLAQTFWHRHRSLKHAAKTRCWHILRSVLVVLALVDCSVAIFNTGGIVPGSFRVCRVCRPLIFMCTTKFLRRTLNRLFLAFLHFWTVLASLALCVIFFVWLGIVIFARSKEGSDYFDEWSNALASLWILFTTANFPDVMIDAYNVSRMSFFFFFSYLVISLYLLNNILLATVYDAYKGQLRLQLHTFYRKKAHSLDRAFHLLTTRTATADGDVAAGMAREGTHRARFREVEASIDLQKWMEFFTAYCHAANGGCVRSQRDQSFIEQRGRQTFQALDSDSSGMISKDEFKLVVHVLSDPEVYIPLRPIPEAGSTSWGRRLRYFFKEGIGMPFLRSRVPWWVLVDLVVLLEMAFAFVQTCIFVSPMGGKFDDAPLMPGSVWFRLLACTTAIFFFDTSLHIVTFGFERYWNRRRLRHRFDVLSISALCGVEIAACCFQSPPDYLLRTLLALHISRGVCLTEHIQPLRYLAALVAHLVPVYHQLGLLLFLVYYVFATIGVQLFGGQIYDGHPALKGSGFAEGEYWSLNFNDFPSGLVTLFCLMVVNNWFVVADGFLKVTNKSASIFFVAFFVTTNLVVLNILMTLILESSSTVREELQAKRNDDETDAPQRSWSRGAREFFLQRMLLNEEERLDTIVSGTFASSEIRNHA